MEVKSPTQSHLRHNWDMSSANQAMDPAFVFTAGDNSLGYLLGPKLVYCCAAKAYLRQGKHSTTHHHAGVLIHSEPKRYADIQVL